ncbi:MAG: ROK family protein [Pyrinomonadaceae bacterium]
MDEIVLAGDLGGTNLRIAAVDNTGRLLYRAEAETPRHPDAGKVVDAVVGLVSECRAAVGANRCIHGFAFAIPAIIQSDENRIFSSPNLPELNGSDLSAELASKLQLKVTLENDATAAAIGEHWLGASSGFDSSICVTLGTGVGGGIILNGEPLRGPDGTAGEIGHICVEPLGAACGCGSFGCLEQYSSASAITRMATELIGQFPHSGLANEESFDALTVFKLGVAGDALCIEVFRRAGVYLGIALSGLINVLNPEVIVIGGGAAEGWDLFIAAVRSEIKKRAFQQPAERARIVRAALGGDAGIIGAARLAFGKAA